MTHLGPYEAKLMEYWEAFFFDRQAHASTRTYGDGHLVRAHRHVDRTQEELGENER